MQCVITSQALKKAPTWSRLLREKYLHEWKQKEKHTILNQLFQKSGPLLPEEIGSCETSIPTDYAQIGYAQARQVTGSFQAPFTAAKGFATRTADDGPTLKRT